MVFVFCTDCIDICWSKSPYETGPPPEGLVVVELTGLLFVNPLPFDVVLFPFHFTNQWLSNDSGNPSAGPVVLNH